VIQVIFPFAVSGHIFEFFRLSVYNVVPWIPEPSTVNNKLKRREGSGIQGNNVAVGRINGVTKKWP
jgi:hypothetical protein